MKKKPLLLLTFLLVLYIGPSIFAISYSQTSIVTELNLTKDFSIAEEEWYNENWNYRKSASIKPSAGVVGYDYQVRINVTYDSDMQNDFDDLRFTDENKTIDLDYWIEDYTDSAFALVWVEVIEYISENQPATIYMYYGNSEASDASDGDATFLFYEDWSTESVNASKWTTNDNDGSISFDDTGADHGSIIRVQADAGANVYQLRAIPTTAAPTSIIGRVLIEKTVGADQRTLWGMSNTQTNPEAFVLSINGAHSFQVRDDGGGNDDQAMDVSMFDTYHNFMITRDGTNARLYDDYSLIEISSLDPDVSGSANIITLYVQDSEYDVYCDWSAQRKFVADEPEVDSWGDEETNLTFMWQDAGEGRFIFIIGWHPAFQFGYDAFFIFLGLIMIVASTMYLVRGGKDEMSSDKFFYFLILFIMGWALFLGGIMP